MQGEQWNFLNMHWMTIEKNFEASGKSHIASSDNEHNYVHPSASLASETSFGKQLWCAQVL